MLNSRVKFLFVFLMSLFFHTTESMEHREVVGASSAFLKCLDVLKINIVDTGPCKNVYLQSIFKPLLIDNTLKFIKICSKPSDYELLASYAYRHLAVLSTRMHRNVVLEELREFDKKSLIAMAKNDLAFTLRRFKIKNFSSLFCNVISAGWASGVNDVCYILLSNNSLLIFSDRFEQQSFLDLPSFQSAVFDSDAKSVALFSAQELSRKVYTLSLDGPKKSGDVFEIDPYCADVAAVDEYRNVYLVDFRHDFLTTLCKRSEGGVSQRILSSCKLSPEAANCVKICPAPRAASVAIVGHLGLDIIDPIQTSCVASFLFNDDCNYVKNACRSRSIVDGASSLFVYDSDAVLLWDLRNTKSPVRKIEFPIDFEPLSIALSGCGRAVATGGSDGTVCWYDVGVGELIHRYFPKNKSTPVEHLTFGPSVGRLLAAGKDRIKIFSAKGIPEQFDLSSFINKRGNVLRSAFFRPFKTS